MPGRRASEPSPPAPPRAAFRGLRPTRLLLSRAAAATTMAAVVTVLAVHGAG